MDCDCPILLHCVMLRIVAEKNRSDDLKRNQSMRRVLLVAIGTVTATVLFGCRGSPPRLGEAAPDTPADCPDELRERVRVAASATAISLPDRLSPQFGTRRSEELLARRLLISAAPARGAAGVTVSWSALTVTIVGGTFAGFMSAAETGDARTGEIHAVGSRSGAVVRSGTWEVARNRAVEVIPGRVRVEPFLSASKLHAETIALDVTVVPGGVPEDKMTVSLPPLWTPDGHPIPWETLEMAVSAERHFTVFDVVEAHVTVDVDGTGSAGSGGLWRCSYETRFTLVDHDSVLPALWDLHIASREGKPKRWLALFEPAVGPFRAIFTDVQAAQAFASWLRTTGATRAGRYQLGLFEADEGRSQSTIPSDRDIASKFRPASSDDVRILTVGRLGED